MACSCKILKLDTECKMNSLYTNGKLYLCDEKDLVYLTYDDAINNNPYAKVKTVSNNMGLSIEIEPITKLQNS